jgi:hypothetical protein
MCKTTVQLWHLKNDGRKLFAGTIEAGSPAEFVLNWSAFLAASERGVCMATYEGSFVGLEAAVESEVGALVANAASSRLRMARQESSPSIQDPVVRHSIGRSDYAGF